MCDSRREEEHVVDVKSKKFLIHLSIQWTCVSL